MATVKQIIERALRSLGVLAEGETASADQAADGLAALRDLLDAWSIKGIYVPTRTVETFTLDPLKQHYTWGSGGDFASAAPTQIYAAWFNDGGGGSWALRQMDAGHYAATPIKAVVARPLAYWYEPGDTGSVRFDQIPIDPSVSFISAKPLTNTQALTDELGIGLGYDRMMRWCLAGEMAPEFGVEIVRGTVLYRNIEDAKRTVANRYAKAPIVRFDAAVAGGCASYSVESGPGA